MKDKETTPDSFFAGLEGDFQEAASCIRPTQDVASTLDPTESIVDWFKLLMLRSQVPLLVASLPLCTPLLRFLESHDLVIK